MNNEALILKGKDASEVTLRTHASSKTSPKVTRKTISRMSNGRTALEVRERMCQKETILSELYENDKCRVLNNMTEIRIVNSKDIVISSEKGDMKGQ